MPATALAAPVEYTALRNQAVVICPTIANPAAPTRSEINAGTDVTRHIPKAGITGFTTTASVIQSDNLATGVATSLDDGSVIDQSTIMFLQAKNGPTHDVRSVLSEAQTCYVLIFDPNDTPANKMDVASVYVQTISKGRQAGAAKMLTVSFQVNDLQKDITVPA